MKVICITDINWKGEKTSLVVGNTYTASQCDVYPNNWDIAELLTWYGIPVSFRKNMFATISTIDETEFERNYQTQTA